MEEKNADSEQNPRRESGAANSFEALVKPQEDRLLKRIQSRLSMNVYADFSADDVLQEALVDAHRGFDDLRSKHPDVVTAWLDRIVDNRLAQTIRDRSRLKRGGSVPHLSSKDGLMGRLVEELQDHDAETGSDRFSRSEIEAAVSKAILKLPDQQRTVIERYYLQQFSLDEIATELKITKASVRGIHYRAKLAMKSDLGGSSRWFKKK